MQRCGVITGDIVGSSRTADPHAWFEALHGVLELLSERYQASSEIYRGDEFQVLIPEPANTVLAAVLIRAAIIAHSPSKRQAWDARLSIGIGSVDELRQKVGESQGEAFLLSGRGLDKLGKSGDRLCILTGSERIDRQLRLLTRLVDDIISHWSHYSAEVAYYSLLYNESQQVLAKRLGRSQPTINTRLGTAKLGLIRAYIEYATEILQGIDDDAAA